MDIATFLTARQAEREAAIRDNVEWWWKDFERIEVYTFSGIVTGGEQYVGPFLDPAGVFVAVAAERAILAAHWDGVGCPTCLIEMDSEEDSDGGSHSYPVMNWVGPCLTLRLLAAPNADHPDYDKSWSPTP